jgi:galactokinase
MDQFIAAMGRQGHALLIDCRSLVATPIPLAFKGYTVVLCDTRVEHSLASSAYNERRAECERGVELIAGMRPDVRSLRDVTPEAFAEIETRLPQPVRRRCRHVVTEDARTLEAADALRSGDVARMGRLMVASHTSLRDDYEVSCRELDALVDAALAIDGVAGSRMTGGGFGGCTVSLVRSDAVEAFSDTINATYERAFGRAPGLYVTGAADGASELV